MVFLQRKKYTESKKRFNSLMDKVKNIFLNKRVCILGPGNTIENKKNGKLFDSYDIKIIVNQMGYVSNLNKEDYGKRIDILFLRNFFISFVIDYGYFGKNTNFYFASKDKTPSERRKFIKENIMSKINSLNLKYIFEFGECNFLPKFFELIDYKLTSENKKDIWYDLGLSKNVKIIYLNDFTINYTHSEHFTRGQSGPVYLCFLTFLKMKELFIAGFDYSSNYSKNFSVPNHTNYYKKDLNIYKNKIEKIILSEEEILSKKYINHPIYKTRMSHGGFNYHGRILLKYLFRDSKIDRILLYNDIAIALFLKENMVEIINNNFNEEPNDFTELNNESHNIVKFIELGRYYHKLWVCK